jgi:hypothetical protein
MTVRRTTAIVLAIAIVAFGAVSQTMGTGSQLLVGGLLVCVAIVFAGLLWRSSTTSTGGARASSSECRAATAGALLTLLLVAYAVSFESLGTAWRVVAAAALGLFGFAVARAFWDRGAAVGTVLAAGVVAYGLLFDTIGGTPRVWVGALLGLVVVATSRRVWRSWAVALSVALAYAVIVYRLFFESIDDVGWRTLVAAALLFTIILIALRWWLYWQWPRTRWAAGVVTLLSLGLVVFTLVRGVDLLGARQPPREQAEAPAVGFVPPHVARPGHGFALGMGVTVKKCDGPVHVKLVVAGTAEYWHDHPTGGPFKLGIPGTDLTNIQSGVGGLSVNNPIDASFEPRKWKTETVQNMTVLSGRLPWLSEVVVEFDAMAFDEDRNWLEKQGQGTCYVRLPALAGNFTAFAAEQADGKAYEEGAFPEESQRDGECVPQISERMHHQHRLEALYCPEAEIVHGSAAVRVTSRGKTGSAGEVLADASLPEPDTAVEGDPVWSCRSDPRGEDERRSRLELAEARSGWPLSTDRLEREIARNCSGFVAISEPDADERRDVTLILIGIGVAIGLGAFIELLMNWVEAEFPFKERRSDQG